MTFHHDWRAIANRDQEVRFARRKLGDGATRRQLADETGFTYEQVRRSLERIERADRRQRWLESIAQTGAQ